MQILCVLLLVGTLQDWPSQYVPIALYPAIETTTPEWLLDLRIVATKLGTPKAAFIALENDSTAPDAMSVADIRTLAREFKDERQLLDVLKVLPTKERRDRAYQTLISFTRWQPQPGFTEEGAQHGGHSMGEKK